MCKKFKKTLKINFLYLTRTLPRTSDRLHMFFTHVFRNSPQHLAVIRGSPQHPAALPRTSFLGALVCRGEPRIKPSVAERRGKQRWCCGKQRWCCSKKYWCSWSNAGAREITHFAILTNFWVRGKTSSAAERNSGVEGNNTGVEGKWLVRGSGGFSSGKI